MAAAAPIITIKIQYYYNGNTWINSNENDYRLIQNLQISARAHTLTHISCIYISSKSLRIKIQSEAKTISTKTHKYKKYVRLRRKNTREESERYIHKINSHNCVRYALAVTK